jgi:hypothetical protein
VKLHWAPSHNAQPWCTFEAVLELPGCGTVVSSWGIEMRAAVAEPKHVTAINATISKSVVGRHVVATIVRSTFGGSTMITTLDSCNVASPQHTQPPDLLEQSFKQLIHE